MSWLLLVVLVGQYIANGDLDDPEVLEEGQNVSDFGDHHGCSFRVGLFGRTACAAHPSVNSNRGPSPESLVRGGASVGVLITTAGEYWRLITGMFLHTGIFHCCNNVIMLLWCGIELEPLHGSWRVAAVYFVSGLYASVMSTPFSTRVPTVGASGCIFGLFGALFAHIWLSWESLDNPCRSLGLLCLYALLQVVMGLGPDVDNLAHIFGCLMGALCSLWFFDLPPVARLLGTRGQQRVCAVVVVLLIAASHAMMYQWPWPAESWCPMCRPMNCLQLPFGCDRYDPDSCLVVCRKTPFCQQLWLRNCSSPVGDHKRCDVRLRCGNWTGSLDYAYAQNYTVSAGLEGAWFNRTAVFDNREYMRICDDVCE